MSRGRLTPFGDHQEVQPVLAIRWCTELEREVSPAVHDPFPNFLFIKKDLKKALEEVERQRPSSTEVEELVTFIKNSKRGICR